MNREINAGDNFSRSGKSRSPESEENKKTGNDEREESKLFAARNRENLKSRPKRPRTTRLRPGETRPYDAANNRRPSTDDRSDRPFHDRTNVSFGDRDQGGGYRDDRSWSPRGNSGSERRGGASGERGGNYNRDRREGSNDSRRPYGNSDRPRTGQGRPQRDYDGGSSYGNRNSDRNSSYGNRAPRDGNSHSNYGNRAPRDGNSQSGYGNRTPRDGNSHSNYGNRAPRDGNSQSGYGNRTPRDGNRNSSYGNRTSSDGSRRESGGYNRDFKDKPRYKTEGTRTPYKKLKPKKNVEEAPIKREFNAAGEMRLNRYLAHAGICSRRQADDYIKAGLVTVNGAVITEMGVKIKQTDDIRYNGERLASEKKIYILLNKPKGYVTSNDDELGRKTILELVQEAGPERVYPVGRLDRNTTGVILLTNDGDMAAKLTHPKYNKKKIYHVVLDKNLKSADLKAITEGITLEDGFIQPDAISIVGPDKKNEVGIEIHSGKNRIVRRIFEQLGYEIVRLDRVYFAGLTKKNLARGKWRFLNEKEINMLQINQYE